MNVLKEKIKAGKKIIGTHLTMGDTFIADIYGMMGYDFVWVDTEHSPMDYGKLLTNLTVLKANKTPAVVRVQVDNYNHTKKVLEMGPDGIIFPMVDTAEYADKCVKSTLYPPLGTRGSGPLRAIRYGMDDMMEYVADQVDNLCRFIQIESITAVKNLPEIVKNPYIDGYIFGPFDMSGSIGRLGDVYCEENMSLIKEAIKILKDNGKFIGMSMTSTDEKEQRFWLDLGVDMVSSGADFDYIMRESRKNVTQLRRVLKDYE
ncbi:MAG: aldolase [Clostridia bacterium]|nr:aldolase [Clostridia bacterium]